MGSEHLTIKTIPIVRMECPTCIPVLEREVKRLGGVEEARGNYMTKTLKVTYDPDRARLQDIEGAIERIGYRIAYKKYPGIISKIKGLLGGEKPTGVSALSDADFTDKALLATKPVAVLFSTPTCPTCRVLKKVYMEVAERLKGAAVLYEMDIATTETWRRYDILATPTILIFHEGEEIERFTGLPRREELETALSG